MTVIITTNEPKKIRELFSDRIETPQGFDFLLYTNRGPFPIERKVIPGDLISSVQDGRLQRELIAMREYSSMYLILLHGKFRYHKNGDLIMPDDKMRVWSQKGIRNLMRSLQLMEGAIVETAEDDSDLINIIAEWQKYLDEPEHRSIRKRPGIDSDVSVPIKTQRVRYFYSGLPTNDGDKIRLLGMEKAKELQKQYSNPIDLYTATIDDIKSIKGFGKNIAENIYNFLRGT